MIIKVKTNKTEIDKIIAKEEMKSLFLYCPKLINKARHVAEEKSNIICRLENKCWRKKDQKYSLI